MGKILVIDGDPIQCAVIKSAIDDMGHDCCRAHSGPEGFTRLEGSRFDIVFLASALRGGGGLRDLPRLIELAPDADFVMLAEKADSDRIPQAFTAGVKHCLVKPVPEERIREVVRDLVWQRAARRGQTEASDHEGIVGDSPAFNLCRERLAISAGGVGNVLIIGEPGTGKRLFARALHNRSDRKNGRYIVADCANLPRPLAESLLFGRMGGASTGTDQDRKGLVHLAYGGTLFMNEIGELDLDVQKALFRVLEDRAARPLAPGKESRGDFRLVAASSRNLEDLVARGEFHRDLHYRLQSFLIELPPLRERNGDIELLARYYLPILCRESGMEEKEVEPGFLETLGLYDWPGNVAQLADVLHAALQKARFSHSLGLHHLPRQLRMRRVFQEMDGSGVPPREKGPLPLPHILSVPAEGFPTMKAARQDAVEAMEQIYLRRLVQLSGASIATACKLSGLSRARLYELLNKHNLSLKSQ
ncbi:sigma 54-interacting transcriptional regulator [Desulfovibrio sp. Huiquan2017]|uniref:sigma-54-dependent transcriptional regulator n=1 Tax=Desulfovibrio sp. Huiquan2017 TaxID=2816861 RepID=UPI00257019B7|nr:sigma 54-interacting transcriptional regulator [Desulfovibrio sp. Huiquan2017]